MSKPNEDAPESLAAPSSWPSAKIDSRPFPPSLASSAALAIRDHGATLQLLAQQEREDAARELPPSVDPSHEWMFIGETEGNQLYCEEVKRAERELLAIFVGPLIKGEAKP